MKSFVLIVALGLAVAFTTSAYAGDTEQLRVRALDGFVIDAMVVIRVLMNVDDRLARRRLPLHGRTEERQT